MSNTAQEHSPTMEYSEITPNIYLGSSMCCEKHSEYHWEKLKELDVYADIDIRLEHKEIPHDIPVHLKLAVEDRYPPTPLQTKLGVDLIDSVVKDNKKVYVHCQVGHGRSPTLVAAYFILKKNMKLEETLKFLKEKRQEVHPTDRQLEFLNALSDLKIF
jgi:protein-tyrosine phosphatase